MSSPTVLLSIHLYLVESVCHAAVGRREFSLDGQLLESSEQRHARQFPPIVRCDRVACIVMHQSLARTRARLRGWTGHGRRSQRPVFCPGAKS